MSEMLNKVAAFGADSSACGSACGASDPKDAVTACGSACGAGDPEEK